MPYEAQNAADLRRQIAEHQANLMRLGEAWGQHIVDELDAADRETIARLQSMLEELKYQRNTAAGIDQLERIRKAIERIRVKAYAKAEKKLRKEAADLIQNEAKWARRILFAFAGLNVVKYLMKPKTQAQQWLEDYAKEHPLPDEPEPEKAHKEHKHKHKKLKVKRLPKPTKEQISKAYTVKNANITKTLTEAETKRLLDKSLQMNKRWDEWWTHTADVDVQRVADAINQGVNNGQTVEEVTAIIRGTKDGNYEDGLLSKNRIDARRMARTITAGIANEAKDQFYRDNSDVVLGVEWLDTLDGRTCMSCASLSRMQWKVDEPHPIPPLHPNCRCVLLPVTALSALVDEQRPAAKSDFMADAKRMYEAKHPGKRFEDLAESTRKKYYYDAIHEYENTNKSPAFEMVGGRASFKDYFENIMTEQQRKDWLGARRYELWKTGKYKFEDFVTPYPDKRMTVDMLKSADKAGLGGDLSGQTQRASQEAIRFTQEYIAINVKTDGLTTKSLNAINYRLAEKMKKYGIDKFDDFLPTDNEYAILGVYPDNKKFAFRADNWNMIVSNPSNYYRKNKGKPGRIRRFAFDSPDDVINHCIDHEVGHAVFNKTTISNKEKLLHNLYINNNFGRDLSQYATESAREFFAENFAIYERGGNLREDVRDFIKRIIENAD